MQFNYKNTCYHSQAICCLVVIFESKFHSPLSGYLLPRGQFWIEISPVTFKLFNVTWSYLDRNSTRHIQAIYCHVVIFGSKLYPAHSLALYDELHMLHIFITQLRALNV